MTFVTTLLLVLLVTMVFPLATVLAGSWLIASAYEETSVLRRGFARIAAHWNARAEAVELDRELAQLASSSHSTSR